MDARLRMQQKWDQDPSDSTGDLDGNVRKKWRGTRQTKTFLPWPHFEQCPYLPYAWGCMAEIVSDVGVSVHQFLSRRHVRMEMVPERAFFNDQLWDCLCRCACICVTTAYVTCIDALLLTRGIYRTSDKVFGLYLFIFTYRLVCRWAHFRVTLSGVGMHRLLHRLLQAFHSV